VIRKSSGFSLIELLIVIAIILLIAAIAIPNMLRARMAANESSAAGSIRTIATAQIAYFNAFPQLGYAGSLPVLGGAVPCSPTPAHACLIDNFLANAIPSSPGKSGYQFQTTGANTSGTMNPNYVTGATPIQVGVTGYKNYCSTDIQVLRANPGVGGMPVTSLAACAAYPETP
jgi:prepilin-type N-terminal cleavage/methylation domain-containing protein